MSDTHCNFRVLKTQNPDDGFAWYRLIEVYYHADKSIEGWSQADEKPSPCGDSLDDVRGDIRLLEQALDRPVLKLKDGKLVEVDE